MESSCISYVWEVWEMVILPKNGDLLFLEITWNQLSAHVQQPPVRPVREVSQFSKLIEQVSSIITKDNSISVRKYLRKSSMIIHLHFFWKLYYHNLFM